MGETVRDRPGTGATGGEVLTRRALNRATLARQLLLRRHALPVADAVHGLAGLNAQNTEPPYLGLWARLDGFRPGDLETLLHERRVVRGCLLRYTQHLVTAEDFTRWRPVLQPVLDRVQRSAFGRRTAGVDLAELAARTRETLRGRTLTRPELGRELVRRWPDHEPSALAWSAQYLVPMVHPPPEGLRGRRGGRTPMALAEDLLGEPPPEPDPEALVTAHLAAFGPATVRDIGAWSGMTRLGEVVDAMRPRLRVLRDEAGTELVDLPDAPRPDPDTPAPVRLLPEFDNLLLAHRDRTRVLPDEYRSKVIDGAAHSPTVLVDGFVRGTWGLDRTDDTATVVVRLFAGVDDTVQAEVRDEAHRLATFAAPEAREHGVTLHRPRVPPGTGPVTSRWATD
ncbi:winged helix DNA-binding domain-containing protein [Saccharomonospora iraqiensis]|uniref:winged helix DNA-binding domain-containing protein n=1 Tax=Saccharomonospora iraqiensis TaxID=52698 RepID=UPI001F2A5CE8|nr:winged helix DNA-binding domain-containing protein [Saccharomonospora iraqiensis]